ncbi:hypothetical protein J6590_079909 [Homalodisca vitripennis]|nr:hypothetical protein J6590_079909 [Homalodisca vitripennis]
MVLTGQNIKDAIRSAKKRYFEDKLVNCRDCSIFWKCLRQNGIVGSKDKKLPLNMNTNDINKYFTEMGTSCEPDEALEQFCDTNRRVGLTNEFKFRIVSHIEVVSAMNEITSKAVGTDDIGIDLLMPLPTL